MAADRAEKSSAEQLDLSSHIVLRPSLWRFWPWWLLFIIAIPICAVISVYMEMKDIPSLLQSGVRIMAWLPVVFPLIILWQKYDVRYDLTDTSIVVTSGLLSLMRKHSSAHYAAVLGVDAQQSVIGMLFNIADISVGTAETSGKEFVLRGIKDWRFFAKLLKARVEHARGRSGHSTEQLSR